MISKPAVPDGPYANATRRTLALALAGIYVWLAWVLIGTLTALPIADTARDLTGRFAVIGCLVGSALVLAGGVSGRWLIVVQLLVLVLAAPLVQATAYADSTPGTMLIVLGLTVAAGGSAIWAVLAVAGGSVAHTLVALAYGDALLLNAQDVVLSSALALAGAAFIGALVSAGAAVDRAEEANRASEVALLQTTAELDTASAFQRVLHDDVLGILSLIAERVGEPERLRTHARAALSQIRDAVDTQRVAVPSSMPSFSGRADRLRLMPLLERLCAAAPIAVSLTTPRQLNLDVSAAQADALTRALGEAIRNVARHAGPVPVEVVVATEATGVRVTVVDGGPGIESGKAEGYGIRDSIRRPIEAIGGSASITSSAAGTRVAVRLPVIEHTGRLVDAHDLTLAAARPVPWPMRLLGPTLAAAWILLAVRLSWPDRDLVALAFAWLALSAIVIARLGRGALTWPWVLGLSVAVITLQVYAATLLPAGSLLDWRSWTYGFSAVPLVLIAFVLPARVSLPVIAINASVPVLAAAISPSLSGGVFPLGAVSGAATSPIAAALVGWLVRRQGRRLRKEQQRRWALDYEREIQRARGEGVRLYFRHVRDEVAPWLHRIAEGEVGASDRHTAWTARLLALGVRDDLHAPGVLDEELRAAVARHRLDGGSVELRVGLNQSDRGSVLTGLLSRLLEIVPPGARVIVAPHAQSPDGLRISMVPSPDIDALTRMASLLAGVRINADEYRAVVEFDPHSSH